MSDQPFRQQLQLGVQHVGLALREPEAFAERWQRDAIRYPLVVWAALLGTAVLGTSTYGLTMGLLDGQVSTLLNKSLSCTLAAGFAWTMSLPTLYILNSLSGSRLSVGATLLAALVTTSWGGLAMIASIPINWFFTVAIPHPGFVLLLNLIVFAGVGVAMTDVFRRVMLRLEPDRPAAALWWIALVGVTGAELFYVLHLFQFGN